MRYLKYISILLIFTVTLVMGPPYHLAQAVAVEIDDTADTTDNSFNMSSPNHVWISDTEGFVIYLDAAGSGDLTLASTTDSGATWGNFKQISSQNDIIRVAVWYDQWTPGDSGTKIHITFIDNGVDDTYYVEYDTITNVSSSEVVTDTELATMSAGANDLSITKATDGDLYVSSDDASDSWVHNCSGSCTSGANWNAITDPWGAADGNDHLMLFPIATGDIMLVHWDTSTNDIESNIYDESAGTWGGFDTSINQNVAEDINYDSSLLAGTIGTTTGEVYISFINDNGGDYFTQDHDIHVWRYDGSWTQLTDVVTNASGGLSHVTMGIDKNGSGTLYVAYVRRTTIGTESTRNIYYRSSTDGGATWSSESSAVNDTEQVIRGLNMNIVDDERLSVTWKYVAGSNNDDLMHETIVDLSSITYEDGHWISPSWDVGSISDVDDSIIEFSSTTPSDTTVTVKTALNTSSSVPPDAGDFDTISVTGGKIQAGSAGGDITGNLSGKYLWVRIEMTASTDTLDTPTVTELIVAINQAAAGGGDRRIIIGE